MRGLSDASATANGKHILDVDAATTLHHLDRLTGMRIDLRPAVAILAGVLTLSVRRVNATPIRGTPPACAARCTCLGEPFPGLAHRWRQKDTTLAESQSFWIRGTVTAVEQLRDTNPPPTAAPLGWRTDRERIVTRFRVNRSWGRPLDRGSLTQVALTTARYSLCPEPSWKVGREYLVYVAVRGDTLVSGGPCWETHEASDSVARRALKELGASDWHRR